MADVEIPVVCPRCSQPALADFPVPVVVIALTEWRQMRLYSSCCSMSWDADPLELQAIEDHVGERWLEIHRLKFAMQTRAVVKQFNKSRNRQLLSGAIHVGHRKSRVSAKRTGQLGKGGARTQRPSI